MHDPGCAAQMTVQQHCGELCWLEDCVCVCVFLLQTLTQIGFPVYTPSH